MLRTHDDWERLVAAVLKKQELWELFHAHSRSPSVLSEASSSDLSPNSSFREVDDASSAYRWEVEEGAVAGLENPARKLVLLSDFVPDFDLEDVRFNSLEPLGEGNFCNTYVCDAINGVKIVVKRVKQVAVSEEEFRRSMDAVGRVGHENVVALRAYYCSEDEKLMLYDYYSEGSVHQLLHGKINEAQANNVGWEARLKIAVGAARGLASMHARKLVHGNVKSSNIFLNSQRYGCLSDHGITNLVSAKLMKTALCYAPEVKNNTRDCSQESDVYSFGILLFELLTRKSPVPISGGPEAVDLVRLMKSVKSKQMTPKVFDADLLQYTLVREDMVRVLEIGISCVVKTAEKRPKMSEVAKMLGDLDMVTDAKNNSLVFVRRNNKPMSEDTMVAHNWITNSPRKSRIGVLSFEGASLMSKLLHLWQLLADKQVAAIIEEITNLTGIEKFVSDNEYYIGNLICSEMSENLVKVARSLFSLSKKCNDPQLRRFEEAFNDFVRYGSDRYTWQFSWKKMEEKSKKMEQFIIASTNLYLEMKSLADLEQALERMKGSDSTDNSTLVEYETKVSRKLQLAKHHKNNSLWNRTFDYVILLLARSVFTVYGRIARVFAFNQAAGFGTYNSDAEVVHNGRRLKSEIFTQPLVDPSESYLPRFSHGPSGFKLWHFWKKSSIDVAEKAPRISHFHHTNLDPDLRLIHPLRVSSQRKPLSAHTETLGAAAMALHYAKVIILIEKLVPKPHLIGKDAREDLYNMLPNSIRGALKARLNRYAMSLSTSDYDKVFSYGWLCSEWKEAITAILGWLAPMAHKTVKWQSERSFEQQQWNLVSRTNVLLVQTLYFANREKTEAAITELLMGLNYVWRFGREIDAKSLAEISTVRTADEHVD